MYKLWYYNSDNYYRCRICAIGCKVSTQHNGSQHCCVTLNNIAAKINIDFCFFLAGGFSEFQKCYPELCDESLRKNGQAETFLPFFPSTRDTNDNHSSSSEGGSLPMHVLSDGYYAGSIPSPDSEAAIERAAVTQVLPYLYLGNARDAQDISLLQVTRAPCHGHLKHVVPLLYYFKFTICCHYYRPQGP